MDKKYNLAAFIESLEGLTIPEIIRQVGSEAERAESESSGVRGAPSNRAAGSLRYAVSIDRLDKFIRTGKFHRETPKHEARMFLRVLQNSASSQNFSESTISDIEDQIDSQPD